MNITNIRAQNVRCFSDQSFELSNGTNIVVGKNAQGKTTVIEAIQQALNARVFRDESNIIRTGQDWARIDVILSDNTQITTKYQKTKQTQKTKISSQPQAIVFEPNELYMFYHSPSDRRVYFDQIIADIDPYYSQTLSNYSRVLKQRNNLLKKPHNSDTMFVWNVRLSELAEQIVVSRKKYIGTIKNPLSEYYKQISSQADEQVDIEYIVQNNNLASIENYTSTAVLEQLEKTAEKDKILGYTSVGPHRDDFLFLKSHQGVKQNASRGEIRTVLLALKKIEADIYTAKTGASLVILLDDAFSELDGTRRQNITKLFSGYQTVITTTDADIITKAYTQHSNIILL